jgi:hypothetical protein
MHSYGLIPFVNTTTQDRHSPVARETLDGKREGEKKPIDASCHSYRVKRGKTISQSWTKFDSREEAAGGGGGDAKLSFGVSPMTESFSPFLPCSGDQHLGTIQYLAKTRSWERECPPFQWLVGRSVRGASPLYPVSYLS